MNDLSLSLPEPLNSFVEAEAADSGFASTGEYIESLVRQEQRRKARERLDQQLLEGVDSGEPITMDDEAWANLRASVVNQIAAAPRP